MVELPKHLAETFLRFFRSHGGFTAQELHEQENQGSTVNAVNNRLEKLRKLEYLKRRREGKSWRYFRTKKRGVQRATDHRSISPPK